MSQPQSTSPDILVVGAGPVGLTVAAELLRHGVASRIIDMNEGPSIWSKAAVVHARTLEVFERMGVVEDALARGRRVHGVGLFSGPKRIGHLSVEDLDSTYPFMLGLSQRETEMLLERHLVAQGGAVERRVELASLGHDGDRNQVTLVRPDGQRDTASFAWVVGCDGAHSAVRHALGLPFEGAAYEESILQADVRIRWPFDVPADEGLFFVSPHGPVGALPLLAEGRYRFIVLLEPGEQADPTLEELQELLDERGPKGAVLSDPAWMVAFRFQRRMVPRYRVGNVLLAGDAAHIHSPVGGQGMNTGIQDAHNLAWKLALVARGLAPASLLDSYHAERAPVAAATLAATDAATRAATRVLGVESPFARKVRDDLLAVAGKLPLVEHRLASTLAGVAIDYRDSPIVAEHVPPLRRAAHLRGAPDAPGLADRLAFEGGPRPGDRVADVDLDEPHLGKDRLHEILRGTAHTLLLFAGKAETRAGYSALGELAKEASARYGDRVKPIVVTPHGCDACGMEWDGEVVRDSGGALRRRFGARSECLYLVRPDGYVGYRSQPAVAEALWEYLRGIFV